MTYNWNVGFQIYKFDLKYTGYDTERSVISVNSKFLINQELNIALGVIGGLIQAFFDKGHSFPNLLDNTPLCWLNIDQVYCMPNYQDFYMWGGITPVY